MLQRVALLEALQAGCPLLLLDEPFSGLDDDGRTWLAALVAERLDAGAAVLLTDHSGSAAGRVALTDVLALRDGAVEHRAVPAVARPALPGAADAVAPLARRLTVRARHADGRRLEEAVAEGAADDRLRALLADGWHIEEVRR
jgi:ABC-type sulfate/molybdate transport systems ATPase subunit